RHFQQQGRYTAGVATRYGPSLLTAEAPAQHRTTGFVVGTRFHSGPVIRLADAKPMQLGHAVEADGRWRLFLFGDRADPTASDSALNRLCHRLLTNDDSPLRRYTPASADIDAVLDVRAVLQRSHHDVNIGDLPPLLRPTKGRYGLIDYQKVFCPDLVKGPDVFDLRSVDREAGAVVIVRPDQHVATVTDLGDLEAIADFFNPFMLDVR
ncbi:MAG: 3-hydroxybenzoate 4-monooxygenase, partial [Actinomycetota bacterium]